ncbi:MAG: YckD family protein [Peptococcaceae bacterium]|nr:YckD family protein [Peptococcaceae bacterium]
MKRRLIVSGIVALLLLALAVPALAATTGPSLDWFKQRMEAKKAYIDQAVQNGQLTPEQGEAWKNHIDQMIRFHEENGFICPGGGPGRMGGFGRWQGGGGPGFGAGAGMTRGWSGPAQNSQ